MLLIRIEETPPVRVMTDYEIASRRAGGGPAANSGRLKSIGGRTSIIGWIVLLFAGRWSSGSSSVVGQKPHLRKVRFWSQLRTSGPRHVGR